jgi:hypothetical protein
MFASGYQLDEVVHRDRRLAWIQHAPAPFVVESVFGDAHFDHALGCV